MKFTNQSPSTVVIDYHKVVIKILSYLVFILKNLLVINLSYVTATSCLRHK